MKTAYLKSAERIYSFSGFFIVSDCFGCPFGAVPGLGCDILIEFRFMADEENRAAVFLQCLLQRLFCIGVKVVCRLIEKKDIGISV